MEFLLGYLLGALSVLSVIYYLSRKMSKKLKKMKDDLMKQLYDRKEELEGLQNETLNPKGQEIRRRLMQASEIAQHQMILRARAEQPSANALDSRYKNGLIGEITTLEHQKLEILKSIIDDGHNPSITVVGGSGEKEEMKLSDYLNEAFTQLGDSTPTPAPLEQEQIAPGIKKVGKFVVYDGGSGNNGEGGTTH